jgi:hypothetical protein
MTENSVTARLVAALEALERQVAHDAECFIKRPCGDDGCPHGEAQHSCDCSRGERLRLAIARATERAVDVAASAALREDSAPRTEAVAAFVSALKEEPQ